MLKTRVLATVSVVALATAAGITGAKADNLVIDLTTPPPVLTIAGGSSAIEIPSEQLLLGGAETAITTNTDIGFPGSDPTKLHDVVGGVDTIIVDNVNSVFASSTGNDVTNKLDFEAATGSGNTSAATLGSSQSADNHTVTAQVDNSNVISQVENLGAGSTVRVNDNNIHADGTVNTGDNLLFGNINLAESSTHEGLASLSLAGLDAGATALVGNLQTITGTADLYSEVTDSRIGLLAQDTTEPNISGSPLDIIGNTIAASFDGNVVTNAVSLTGDQAITLTGSAGVASGQIVADQQDLSATARNVVIEGANTQDFVSDQFIADLNSSTLTLQNNKITASASANQANNSVSLADNINLNSVSTTGRLNNFSAVTDTANVAGDLFVANGQYTNATVTSTVDDGDMYLLLGDSIGSTVTLNDNTISSSATGSGVTNAIDVGNTADFTGIVAINTIQYNEGVQSANNNSLLAIDTGSTDASTESVAASSVTADSNSLNAEAMGNTHSSTLNITGTTVNGGGSLVLNPILSTRSTTKGSVSADFSILNGQVLDGGVTPSSVTADLVTGIDVYAGDKVFTVDSLSASGNDIHGLAIGNLSTEASVSIDATTLAGTVGVLTSQTVEDGVLLSSTITPAGTLGAYPFIDVVVGTGNAGADSALVKQATVNADSNTFDSRVWGNLADATTNSIQITGVTIGSGGPALRSAGSVTRGAVSDSALDSTIALVNDQSVEDLNGSVATATANGHLIGVTVGNDNAATSATDSTVTARSNSATTSAAMNQATSEIGVSATSLNDAVGLANVQTLTDQDGNNVSGSIYVNQNNLDITIDVIAGNNAMQNLTVQADNNSTLASGRINQATNSIDVAAQTQTLEDTIDPVIDPTPASYGAISAAPSATYGNAETLLMNDQSFNSLGAAAGLNNDGLAVLVSDNDITVDLSLGGNDLVNTVASTSGNSQTAVAAGNDATNSLKLAVGSFDLSAAANGAPPTEANGPIAAIVSNQTGTSGTDSGAITATITDSTISVDGNTVDTFNITGSNLASDSNSVRTLARSNNVSNVLNASGTTVQNDANDNTLSSISGSTAIVQLDQPSFAVASRQVSSVDMVSTVNNTAITVDAGDVGVDPLLGGISGTSITTDSNLVVAEARGNDAGNGLSTDFVDNAAQATVANAQVSGGLDGANNAREYTSQVLGTQITVLTDVAPVTGSVTGSAFSASGNAVAALSSANRATNVLSANGTNVEMRNGTNTTEVDPTAGSVTSDGSLAVLNVQGAPDLAAAPIDVNAGVEGALIGVYSNGLFDSGSVTADSNLILAQAVEHSATNTLNMTASANIGSNGVSIDDTPGASVASLQTISDNSSVSAQVIGAGVAAFVDDQRDPLSMTASASSNQILASAIGGTATNALHATAGAEIDGLVGTTPTVGDGTTPIALNAGFNVLNAQQGTGSDFTAGISLVGIGAGGAEDYNGDSAVVNNNVIQAEARAFTAANTLTLDAGSSSNATAAIANSQVLSDSTIEAGIEGAVILTGNLDEGAVLSSLTVDGNTVQAISSANKATNSLTTTAAA
ncbi:MAG: hypothetical protein GC201_07955, partial [Alphaproteobacteria bacterium]|nr:hypothetical protein [Alphaproteobacteria bacterium]